jgi:hypothetical protein
MQSLWKFDFTAPKYAPEAAGKARSRAVSGAAGTSARR